MDIDTLSKFILKGESSNLEFKKSTSLLDSAGETLCAFLNSNTENSTVIIGVKDNGELVGQMVSDNTRKEIAQMIGRFEPSAQITSRIIPLKHSDKSIILLQAKPHIVDRPYAYKGKSYQRLESSTRLMSQNSKKHILLENMQAENYEDLTTTHVDLSLLDETLIRKTVELGIEANRIPVNALEDSLDDLLGTRFHILKDGYITNAGMILFGKNLGLKYPQCFLKMAVFEGNSILSNMRDSQQLYGNAFEIYQQAMKFAQHNLKVSSIFEENSLERRDIPQIPILALRELIVNAICHRDYSDKTGEITLAIFNDRLEVWNIGKLHSDLSIEKLKEKHASRRTNPKIAEVFYFCKYIDRWGMGTLRVIELCQKNGMPEPHFKEENGGISAILYFAHSEAKVAEKIDLTARQCLIFNLLATSQGLSFQEIKSTLKLEIAERTLRNELLFLKEKNLVELIGRGQHARWKKCVDK